MTRGALIWTLGQRFDMQMTCIIISQADLEILRHTSDGFDVT